ncbi:MAG: questin oxidase family protein [Actinomycetes bacterium]
MSGDIDDLGDGLSDAVDEALVRLHAWGPEWHGRLSNHAPMVVEAMVRHGRADSVERWVDRYQSVLEPPPPVVGRIPPDDWGSALGDPSRLTDWVGFFEDQLAEHPWQDVLVRWWPHMLPGLAASATHSVIRLGHAVRTLRDRGESAPAIAELSQSLGYWAGRWLPVSGNVSGQGDLDIAGSLAQLPALGVSGAFPDLLDALGTDGRWPGCAGVRLTTDPQEVSGQLKALVTAATLHYRSHGHGDPIMLVHAATSANAVLRVLPSLPPDLWVGSLHAAWEASAAITMMYNPGGATTSPPAAVVQPMDADTVFDRAVEHGDEHVIKLADTAIDVHEWSPASGALDAAFASTVLIEPQD